MNKREILCFAIHTSHSRPDADMSIEQYLMTPESMATQTVQLQDYFCDKRVLYLGDDDHMSVMFAYFLKARSIVLEYDSRIRKNLASLYEKYNVQSPEIIKYDARRPMPADLTADCSSVFIKKSRKGRKGLD